MKIILPTDFLEIIKDKGLLLDTNFFIDAFLNSVEFGAFIKQLKDANVTLISLDVVKIEFLKGAVNTPKYKEKQEYFEQIIQICLPLPKNIFDNAYKLLQLYKEDGKPLSITDLLLGAALINYQTNLFLLTKNTTDFPSNIFTLSTHINLLYRKGLHVYGVYQYVNSNWKGNRDL